MLRMSCPELCRDTSGISRLLLFWKILAAFMAEKSNLFFFNDKCGIQLSWNSLVKKKLLLFRLVRNIAQS